MVINAFLLLIFYLIIVNTNSYNNAVVISKKTSKIFKFFVLQIAFFPLKFAVTAFAFSSIISSQVITESS